METAQIERLLDVAKYIILYGIVVIPIFLLLMLHAEDVWEGKGRIWLARISGGLYTLILLTSIVYRIFGYVKWGY